MPRQASFSTLLAFVAASFAAAGCAAPSDDPADEIEVGEADLTSRTVEPWADGVVLVRCATDAGVAWTSKMPTAEGKRADACAKLRLPGRREGTFTEVEYFADGFPLRRTGAGGAWVRLRFKAYGQFDGDATLAGASEPSRLLFRDGLRGSCTAYVDVTGTKAAPSTHEVVIQASGERDVQLVLANAFRRVEPRAARRVFVSDVEVSAASEPKEPRALPTGTCRQTVDAPDELPAGFDPFSPSSCTGKKLTRTQRVALAGKKLFDSRRLGDMDVYVRESRCTPEGCDSPGKPRRLRNKDDLDAVTSDVTAYVNPTPKGGPYATGVGPDVSLGIPLWGRCTGALSCTPDGCGGDVFQERSSFWRADGREILTCENRTVSVLQSSGTMDMRADCTRVSVAVEKGGKQSWTRYELAGVIRY